MITRLVRGLSELFNVLFRLLLDTPELVESLTSSDQLVELGVDGGGVSVLGVLNEEHHQKSDDRRTRIYEKLPDLGEVEEWSAESPQKDYSEAHEKSRRSSGGVRHKIRGLGEALHLETFEFRV